MNVLQEALLLSDALQEDVLLRLSALLQALQLLPSLLEMASQFPLPALALLHLRTEPLQLGLSQPV